MIKLYNSVKQKKEEFIPLVENKVSFYVCGPTVYNYIHIGNARPMITFDLLRRLFEFKKYDVTHISNFTDVDDKIINRAKEEGITEDDVTRKYIDAYLADSMAMNITEPTHRPKVTEKMAEIIKFIGELIAAGYAYEVGGDVYFRVGKVAEYGKISNRNIEDLISGARVEKNDLKENPLDFTLWKETSEGVNWESPWSKGRPGWHTECVVMINDIAGPLIDIHGGGMDLKFPHHENEVAQANALYGTDLANYWMHNGFINLDGTKMSKSLGNVKWTRDVLEVLGTNVFRTTFYMTHYLKPMNFTEDTIEQAKKFVAKFVNSNKMASEKWDDIESAKSGDFLDEFVKCLSDDLNTPNAMAVMLKANKEFNKSFRSSDFVQAKTIWAEIKMMMNLFGWTTL